MKAFIETTVLTNLLLKKNGMELQAETKIDQYQAAIIPEYAWKEFKQGPLAKFVWAHNKLSETGSFAALLLSLQRISFTPQRYFTATAIEAIHAAATATLGGASLADLSNQYGLKANADSVLGDILRLELKRAIAVSWMKRKTLYGGSSDKLDCYEDTDLIIKKNGFIDLAPRDCPSSSDCCLKKRCGPKIVDVDKIREALKPFEAKKEIAERRRVLRQISKHPSTVLPPKDCRRLGDAYFVLFCPVDAEILSTNVGDFQPMVQAVGKTLATP